MTEVVVPVRSRLAGLFPAQYHAIILFPACQHMKTFSFCVDANFKGAHLFDLAAIIVDAGSVSRSQGWLCEPWELSWLSKNMA